MAWSYQREERKFEQLPEGDYRIRIKDADKAISKNGNDMLTLQFEVSGESQILYHYIVFLDDRPEITNRMLTQFFDSFPGIEEGDFNISNWIGKVGACRVKHEEYQGDMKAKIHYFISAKKAEDLPMWREPKNSSGSKPAVKDMPVDENGFMSTEGADGLPDFI